MDIIIETPKGSRQKYTYDKELKLFRLKKVLAAGLVFPYDFGFIPGTKGEDGDPFDILVLSEFQGFPGCVVDVRIVGCLPAMQTHAKKSFRNDRYIGILEQSTVYERITSLEELPMSIIDSIKLFFTTYLQAEGKTVHWENDMNALQAIEVINKAVGASRET
ncbi:MULTISPECIES: inorganic diphosphatase [Niastella]|uniref:inorganic diphosphatase n=1 Tax=Niastella soli TaxID=2821487 RepID=A0ABS3YVQ6_9BACT|nr:inorganic diphosphatase [Niastella soli]MBO9201612.1 inorganic diphosphatase [Niastella soli]